VQELADVAIAETLPRMEGNQMHTILSRKAQSGGGKAKPAAAAAVAPPTVVVPGTPSLGGP